MKRRAYLGTGAVLLGGLAGCTVTGESRESAATATPYPAEPLARNGVPPDVCEEPVREDIGIVEIVEPGFGPDWDGLEVGGQYAELSDESVVVGVEQAGRGRAYPLSVLWYHEIVNDTFDEPLLVTYCPLCKSGVVAERRVSWAASLFRVSGLLWRPERIRAEAAKAADRVFGADMASGETEAVTAGNLVMVDDRSGSYWSQLLAQAICGPQTGDRLTIVPSAVARWGEWRAGHPDGEVLLPPPYSAIAEP